MSRSEEPGPEEPHRARSLRRLWPHYILVLLGAWLLVSPPTFGYTGTPMAWSDLASGGLLVVLGLLSRSGRRLWAPWAAFGVGVWLHLAPLLLWAEEPAAYLNATAAGVAAVALSVLVPGPPGEERFREPGPEVPPGWSYNPSAWPQRMPLVVLALGGWFMSRYLAAFHLGFIDWASDPLFGDGTVRVLTSEISEAFPVSDAGLGAVAYTFEALLAFLGARDRWRTNPSTVIVFGLLVIPLGATHLVLVTLMPVVVGHWCTFCLLTALLMLVMVPLAIGEIVATLQFLGEKRREGHGLGSLLVKGGGLPGRERDERSPALDAPWRALLPAMVWGVSVPVTLLVAALLGALLMAAPGMLETAGSLADANVLTGALVLTVSVVAMGEVVRACRFLLLPLALWLVVAPWVMSGATAGDMAGNAVAGLLLGALALPRGAIRERYGSWEQFVL